MSHSEQIKTQVPNKKQITMDKVLHCFSKLGKKSKVELEKVPISFIPSMKRGKLFVVEGQGFFFSLVSIHFDFT